MSFKRILAIIVRHIYNFKHNLDRLSDSFYWPAIDILLWGLTSQYIQGSDFKVNNILLIMLSGLVFWQVIWRGQYEITVNFLEEIWNQNLVNLFATPLTVTEWIISVLTLGLIKMIFTISFAFLLSWLLYSVNLFVFGWLLIPFLASLLMMGWWVGLIVSGILVRFGRSLQTLAWVGVYLLAPFSAVFYPLNSLPIWAQKVARLIPSSYIFEGMREVLTTNQIHYTYLTISLILNFTYLILSFFFFKFCFKKSKELGLARLE